jgi:hypothetical protein
MSVAKPIVLIVFDVTPIILQLEVVSTLSKLVISCCLKIEISEPVSIKNVHSLLAFCTYIFTRHPSVPKITKHFSEIIVGLETPTFWFGGKFAGFAVQQAVHYYSLAES